MESNQIKLLIALAKRIKSEKKDRSQAIASLQSAKILDKDESFTKPYRNLEKAVLSIN